MCLISRMREMSVAEQRYRAALAVLAEGRAVMELGARIRFTLDFSPWPAATCLASATGVIRFHG